MLFTFRWRNFHTCETLVNINCINIWKFLLPYWEENVSINLAKENQCAHNLRQICNRIFLREKIENSLNKRNYYDFWFLNIKIENLNRLI